MCRVKNIIRMSIEMLKKFLLVLAYIKIIWLHFFALCWGLILSRLATTIYFSILGETSRGSLSQMFFRMGVLKSFANFIRKHQRWIIFTIKKLQAWTLLKRDSTQVFSCEICDIFKNTFFYRTLPVAASEQTQEIYVVHCVAKWCSGHLAQVYFSYPISCLTC